MTMNDLAVPVNVQQQFGQEDLAELGAVLASAGWTTLEARQLITMMQQVGLQVALNMAPAILEQVRLINVARVTAMYTQVRMLPNMAGYVSRDRVLQIIQTVTSTPPRN
jgi:hypothetical protein